MSFRRFITTALATSATLLVSAGHVYANAYSSVQDFTNQMGTYNVITSGNFTTNNHVHGRAAVGGTAALYGNAEINSHSISGEALRVYGKLNLTGETKVMAGGATILKNGSVNSTVRLHQGQPNPNQSVINYNSASANTATRLIFNGNGGGTPTLNSIATADTFFSSRDSVMQAANTSLLASAALTPTVSGGGNTLTFSTAASGVTVFNWNIDSLTGIAQVGFNYSADSFIVVNIRGNTFNETWNAAFNTLNGNDALASHVLWNIGVANVNFTGDQLLGSILAPDSTINSWKQLNGAIYAGAFNQYDREIHYTPYTPPTRVPDEPSLAVLGFAALSMGTATWIRRRHRRSTQTNLNAS